jgi:hypothetical protein
MPRQRCSDRDLKIGETARSLRLPVAMLAVAMAVCGLAPAPAQARAPAQPEAKAAGELAEVHVVTFETQVIDGRARPVRGLARWDFTLRVDGVETPVDYLIEVRDGQVGASSLAQLAPPGPVVAVGAPVIKDAGSYYLLGFTVNRASDSRRHELRVEVAQRRTAVRAPSAYFDNTLETESAAAEGAPQSGSDANSATQ